MTIPFHIFDMERERNLNRDGLPRPWQERADWTSTEMATKIMVAAMKAEIAEWREYGAACRAVGIAEGRAYQHKVEAKIIERAACRAAAMSNSPEFEGIGEADCHESCGHIGAECDYPACKQPSVGAACRAATEAREIYTCIGKGGEYELVGVAKGAGKSKLVEPLTIYRDAASGALYFRTGDDFAERMELVGAACRAASKAKPCVACLGTGQNIMHGSECLACRAGRARGK